MRQGALAILAALAFISPWAPVRADADYPTTVLELSGAAGEWVLVTGDLPDRPASLDWHYVLAFSAAGLPGGPVNAILAPPTLIPTLDGETGPALQVFAAATGILADETGALATTRSRNSFLALSGARFADWALVAGADGPWTLTVQLTRFSSPLEDPVTIRGSGLSFARSTSEVSRPLDGVGPGTARHAITAELQAAGWTHLELQPALADGPLGPTHFAEDKVGFPNGHLHLKFGLLYEAGGFRSAPTSAIGTFADTPGTLVAEHRRAGWSLDTVIRLVHVPIARDQYPESWLPLSYDCTPGFAGGELCFKAFSPSQAV